MQYTLPVHTREEKIRRYLTIRHASVPQTHVREFSSFTALRRGCPEPLNALQNTPGHEAIPYVLCAKTHPACTSPLAIWRSERGMFFRSRRAFPRMHSRMQASTPFTMQPRRELFARTRTPVVVKVERAESSFERRKSTHSSFFVRMHGAHCVPASCAMAPDVKYRWKKQYNRFTTIWLLL